MHECDHGSIVGCCPVEGCPYRGAPLEPPPSEVTAGPVEAFYPGRCMACGGAVFRGDVIVQVDHRWIHERCPQ